MWAVRTLGSSSAPHAHRVIAGSGAHLLAPIEREIDGSTVVGGLPNAGSIVIIIVGGAGLPRPLRLACTFSAARSVLGLSCRSWRTVGRWREVALDFSAGAVSLVSQRSFLDFEAEGFVILEEYPATHLIKRDQFAAVGPPVETGE
jgi:hypothetical protein